MLTVRTKTALAILHLRFKYFAAYFFKAFDIHLSRKAKEMHRYSWHSLLSPSLCLGMITQVCQSFQNARPLATHKSAKQLLCSRLWPFQVGFNRNMQHSVFWQRQRLRLQWWFFHHPNAHPVCAMVWGRLISEDLWNTLHLLRISFSLLS